MSSTQVLEGVPDIPVAPAAGGPPPEAVPFIVRLAGLPACAAETFAGEACAEGLRHVLALEPELASARTALVERLYEAIPGAPPPHRGFFLAVKRDCYNGRSLESHRGHLLWDDLSAIDPEAVGRLLALEEHYTRERGALARDYRRQRNAERRDLARLAEDRELLRGVAVSSSTTAALARRLAGRPVERWGRRERRLELTLARYVSRAALKLSPFSTLTRVGLGLADPDLPAGGFEPLPRASEHSFVRLRRYLVDQCADLLLGYPPFRGQLPVVLNRTFERFPDGSGRFVKTGSWTLRSDGSGLEYRQPALVRTAATGPVVGWLWEHARQAPVPRAEVAAALTAELAEQGVEAEAVERALDSLLDGGLLVAVPPWREDDVYLEPRLLAALEDRAGDDSTLVRLRRLLRRLVEAERGYAAASDPAGAMAEAARTAAEMGRALVTLAGGDPDAPLEQYEGPCFNEDVFVEGEGGASEVLRVAREDLEGALRDLEPIARLGNLAEPRHDLLHTLAAFGAERWPAGRVPLLEFFAEAQPLFREYVRHRVGIRHRPPLAVPAWNPLGLESVERLERARQRVQSGLDATIEAEGEVMVLRREAIEALLEDAPGGAADLEPFAAHLQPLDPARAPGRWVLNTLFEGAGRHSSRYSVVMPPDQQAAWTAHFERRAVVERDGEACELAAIVRPASSNSNLHVPQTPRLLALDEGASRLPPERLLRVRDLRVELRGAHRPPVLVDPAGRRILPVHLGGTVFRYLPTLCKFLVAFGPGELPRVLPKKGQHGQGDVRIDPLHRIGDVVLSRRAWVLEPARLLAELRGLDEVETFVALNRWRQGHGIPERVFLREPLRGGVPNPQRKPQYIDFRSPVLARIFRAALEIDVPTLRMVEAMPAPEAFPAWADGERRGVELQADSLAFETGMGTTQNTVGNASFAWIEATQKRPPGP